MGKFFSFNVLFRGEKDKESYEKILNFKRRKRDIPKVKIVLFKYESTAFLSVLKIYSEFKLYGCFFDQSR